MQSICYKYFFYLIHISAFDVSVPKNVLKIVIKLFFLRLVKCIKVKVEAGLDLIIRNFKKKLQYLHAQCPKFYVKM